MTDELIGKTLGGYEILERIGQGGMATVYRARQTSMNRIVALKILPRHMLRDETYLKRFEREVAIIATLEHRSIVPVHDYGEYDGQPFIAMRYLTGGSVDDLLKKGPLSLDNTLKIIEEIAPALDYAHSKHILHRDLKPSNILMDDNGDAYITDFGIARIANAENPGETLTTQGVVGTPSYMSPEQAQGHELDGRSDVYAIGVMLFEMLTGRRPFQNDTPYGIAVMQVTTPPPVPRSINPQIPGPVERVILKSLKKKPDERYQTTMQLAADLRLAIERPESMHDTQPRAATSSAPSPQAMNITKPAQPTPGKPPQAMQQTMPSSAVQQPVVSPPVYTPPPNSAVHPPASRLRKRRKGGGVWTSIALGALIGCALLAALVAAGLFVVNDLFAPEGVSAEQATQTELAAIGEAEITEQATAATDAPTATRASTEVSQGDGTPRPTLTAVPIIGEDELAVRTLDPTSDTMRATLLPDRDGVAPVGVRETPTPDPDFDPQFGKIIYFFLQDGISNIFQYDLFTGETTQLTEIAATTSYAVASPDGRKLVFQSYRDGSDFDIYTLDLETGSLNALTDNDLLDRTPAWSPDGDYVVYSSDTRGDNRFDLYRVPATGGEPEMIFSNGVRNSHPRYSSDGRSLVFTSGGSRDASDWNIVKLDLATGETTNLTNDNLRDASPSFSPDDRYVLYTIDGTAIARVLADGGEPEILYEGPGFISGASYSPDGRHIVFDSQIGNDPATLFIMDADGGNVREIRNILGFYPSWLP